jgi:hypothetical protein
MKLALGKKCHQTQLFIIRNLEGEREKRNLIKLSMHVLAGKMCDCSLPYKINSTEFIVNKIISAIAITQNIIH